VLDIAAELTPEQRAKLADRADAMAQHGPMGGHMGAAWGGSHGGPMGGPWHRPVLDGQGPGDGPTGR
jgi:hypothetical protein